ncbi:hypothetical protein M514_08673 [Trichuris suis]|uniref:Uncharacterized protein n=1 Tax=Trichuris suis TaxID=68888 RepID=A0A085MYN3_9BILA|nr:hypothetical protein M513_08673 [Trichuris suis]KFD62329.1 hypothetical protein M514_08673 [Trichuris suis]
MKRLGRGGMAWCSCNLSCRREVSIRTWFEGNRIKHSCNSMCHPAMYRLQPPTHAEVPSGGVERVRVHFHRTSASSRGGSDRQPPTTRSMPSSRTSYGCTRPDRMRRLRPSQCRSERILLDAFDKDAMTLLEGYTLQFIFDIFRFPTVGILTLTPIECPESLGNV